MKNKRGLSSTVIWLALYFLILLYPFFGFLVFANLRSNFHSTVLTNIFSANSVNQLIIPLWYKLWISSLGTKLGEIYIFSFLLIIFIVISILVTIKLGNSFWKGKGKAIFYLICSCYFTIFISSVFIGYQEKDDYSLNSLNNAIAKRKLDLEFKEIAQELQNLDPSSMPQGILGPPPKALFYARPTGIIEPQHLSPEFRATSLKDMNLIIFIKRSWEKIGYYVPEHTGKWGTVLKDAFKEKVELALVSYPDKKIIATNIFWNYEPPHSGKVGYEKNVWGTERRVDFEGKGEPVDFKLIEDWVQSYFKDQLLSKLKQ